MPAKVLVCDNEEVLRRLVRAALDGGAYEIAEARDGDESVELARRLEPDLIVLDIMMPGRSGSRCSGSCDGTRVSARRRS
jgi:CheY-like chemotaxis protein